MKRTILMLLACTSTSLFAQSQIKVGDFVYEVISEKTVELHEFTNTEATKVDVPATVKDGGKTYQVTVIGESAFENKSNLVSITIPNGIIDIKKRAFRQTGITAFEIPNTVKNISDYAFDATYLSSIEIPSSVERIGANAFFGYTDKNRQLKSVKLNEGLKYIGSAAFYNTQITDITIPASVDSIDNSAFFKNAKLQTVKLQEGLKYIGDGAFKVCETLSDIKLPSTLTYLGAQAFFMDRKLTSINLPENLKKIGGSAFSASGINIFDIAPNNAYFKVVSGCLYDTDNKVFYAVPMTGTTEVKVLDKTIGIMDGAFWGSQVSKVVLPETIIGIGEDAFCETPLASINLPKGIFYIGEEAFGCTNLTEVVVPENTIHILKRTFAKCPNLKKVTLPSGVKALDTQAFIFSPAIESVTCRGSVAPHLVPAYDVDEYQFSVAKTIPLYVPKGCTQSYKDEGWDSYLAITETSKGVLKHVSTNPIDSISLQKNATATFEINFDEEITIIKNNPDVYIREQSLQTPPYKTFDYGWNARVDNKKTLVVYAADADGYTDTFIAKEGKGYYVVIPEGTVKNSVGEENEQIVMFFYGPNTTSGITNTQLNNATNSAIVTRYNLQGQVVSSNQRGIQIIKYADGTVRKVVIQ